MTGFIGTPSTALTLANPWALVPALGNLDAYISAVNRMPMLTLEEEQSFARKFRIDNDLEAAGNVGRGGAHAFVADVGHHVGELGHGREHRHQMRLARAVIADDEDALVVDGAVEAQLGDDHVGQRVGHAVGDDVGAHEVDGALGLGRVAQLDDAFNGFKLDQVAVEHGSFGDGRVRA